MAGILVVLEAPCLRQVRDEGILMNRSLGAASLFLGAVLLSGCTSETTCYGVEPDGEVEKLRPCPEGWKDGDTRHIGEDEFKRLEVVDLKSNKKNKGTTTVTVQAPNRTTNATPKPTIPKYTTAPAKTKR